MVDGDDTYPAECAPEMVDAVINKNADMVVGDRLGCWRQIIQYIFPGE